MTAQTDYEDNYPALIERINLLARKKRDKGLSAEESAEQKKLYAIYLSGIRRQMTDMLDSIEVVDEVPCDPSAREHKIGKSRIIKLNR